MKTISLANRTIKLYDSIDEMPIENFQRYNKYIIIDAGLGSDIDSVDEHIVQIAKLINSGDKKKAMQELQNMRQNMHMIVSGISPRYMAFAALIYSIDGKKVESQSDTSLQELLSDLKKVEHGSIIETLFRLKKKLSTELETYFPDNFDSAKEKMMYEKIKQRTILQLKGIIEDKEYTEEIADIDLSLLKSYKPGIFTGKNSFELKYDKQFESLCMLVGQKANLNAKQMTVLQFYTTVNNIKAQLDAEAKAYKRIKHR